jgi:hypothetical protein
MTGKLLDQISNVLPFYTASYSGKLEYSSVSLWAPEISLLRNHGFSVILKRSPCFAQLFRKPKTKKCVLLWHHRESNPLPSGFWRSASIKCANAFSLPPSDTLGNRTRVLPASGGVPQPSASQRAMQWQLPESASVNILELRCRGNRNCPILTKS